MLLDLWVVEVEDVEELGVIVLDAIELGEVAAVGLDADVVQLLDEDADVRCSAPPLRVLRDLKQRHQQGEDVALPLQLLHELLVRHPPVEHLADVEAAQQVDGLSLLGLRPLPADVVARLLGGGEGRGGDAGGVGREHRRDYYKLKLISIIRQVLRHRVHPLYRLVVQQGVLLLLGVVLRTPLLLLLEVDQDLLDRLQRLVGVL